MRDAPIEEICFYGSRPTRIYCIEKQQQQKKNSTFYCPCFQILFIFFKTKFMNESESLDFSEWTNIF